MLTIERMKLRLPDGFQHRADRIARLVSEELAEISFETDITIERLEVPPIKVEPVNDDQQIARRIATAIHTQIGQVEK